MPNRAHSGGDRGPFAALLILLGLLVSSGPIAGVAQSVRDATPRLGSLRPAGAATSLRSSDRVALANQTSVLADDSFTPPSPPTITRADLTLRPAVSGTGKAFSDLPQRSASSYQARAPPAA